MTDARTDGQRVVDAVTALFPAGQWARPEIMFQVTFSAVSPEGRFEEVDIHIKLRRTIFAPTVVEAPPLAEIIDKGSALTGLSPAQVAALRLFPPAIFGRAPEGPEQTAVFVELEALKMLKFESHMGWFRTTPLGAVAAGEALAIGGAKP